MRGISIREACRRRLWVGGVGLLLAAWAMLCPEASAEVPDYAPAHPQIWWPLGSTRPEDGGPFFYSQYTMYRQTNPLRDQPIAIRGFFTSDNSLGVPVGTLIGSGSPALNVNNLNGQVAYQPGFEVGLGWKLKDGSAITLSYLWLSQTQYQNGATLSVLPGRQRPDLADTFLSSFVYNFPPEYSGPANKIVDAGDPTAPLPSPTVAFGIWNGASVMTIEFIQRFQQFEATYRFPIIDEEDYRVQGLVGPRLVWIWERFLWRTVSYGIDPASGAAIAPSGSDVGLYTNITSNRMYGVHAGCQTECYLGHGFALLAEAQGALFFNSVKERARYQLGEYSSIGFPASKRAKREFSIVPELSAMLALQWYPTEFVQVQIGYEAMAFFNTLSSTRPIDYNYLNLAPQWDHVNRLFDGFRFGVALWF